MKEKIKNGMTNFKLTGLMGFILLSGMLITENAQATCSLESGNGTVNGNTPLIQPVALTAPFSITRLTGSSEATGTPLYSGEIIPYLNARVSCTSPMVANGIVEVYEYESAPLGLWAGDIGMYSGKIYNTGLDGVGLVVVEIGNENNVAPMERVIPIGSGATSASMTGMNFVYYRLIKTGPLSYGTIDGTQLPVLKYHLRIDDGTISKIDVFSVNFSGIISVNKPTCHATETDKVVQLGTWDKNSFANVGDASSWVDSSLNMVCDDAFYGSGGEYNFMFENDSDGNVFISSSDSKANSSNVWGVRFTSSTGLIDATQGIIALDSSNGDNATGVGIQLSASTNVAGIVDLTTGWSGTIGLGSSAFRVPIYARYIRTGDITAGSANGKVIYTVDYQ